MKPYPVLAAARFTQRYTLFSRVLADSPYLQDAPDNGLISLNHKHELRTWCTALDCPAGELWQAVTTVGH